MCISFILYKYKWATVAIDAAMNYWWHCNGMLKTLERTAEASTEDYWWHWNKLLITVQGGVDDTARDYWWPGSITDDTARNCW